MARTSSVLVFLILFQAEHGIRDIGVTGVQTCALPICADEIEVATSGRGQLLQCQVLDDVDAASGQEDQVSWQEAAELGIAHPRHVPGHVVRSDRKNSLLRQPVGGARRHPWTGKVAIGGIPVTGVAGPHERHVSRLDAHTLPIAALLEVFVGDGVAGLQRFEALAGDHVEEDAGSQDRRHLFDTVLFEATRGLYAAVHLHTAVEHKGVRLVAESVYVVPVCSAQMMTPAAPVHGPASSGRYSSSWWRWSR